MSTSTVPWKTARAEFSDGLASKVMGWTLIGDDWHRQDEDQKYKRVGARITWTPLSDARSTELLWIKCLEKAKETGYVLSQETNGTGQDRRYHINGDHPAAKRLLVVDPDYKVAVCRFAAALFDFTPPYPYEINPPRDE